MALQIFTFSGNSGGLTGVSIPAGTAAHRRLRVRPPLGHKYIVADPGGNTYQMGVDEEFVTIRSDGQGVFRAAEQPISVQLDTGSSNGFTGFLD